MGDSGPVVQSADAECIISRVLAFQTFSLAWADTSALLTSIRKSKTRTAWSLFPRGDTTKVCDVILVQMTSYFRGKTILLTHNKQSKL